MNTTHISGRLEHVERLKSSRLGNPRFDVTIGGHTARTVIDGAVGYVVENHRIGRTVTATLNARGAIIDIVDGLAKGQAVTVLGGFENGLAGTITSAAGDAYEIEHDGRTYGPFPSARLIGG